METALAAVSSLQTDAARVESELKQLLGSDRGSPGEAVRTAMQHAVLGRGRRIRPTLALRVARLGNADSDLVLRAAAAVELLHCASLIVDDLPCMDNESERRGQPTCHAKFGEPTALLAAFGLVAMAARCVVEQRCTPTEMSNLIRFQVELLKMLDCSCLIAGQDMDLKLTGAGREAQRDQMTDLKTVPLFVLSAQAGLLFEDPNSLLARQVRRFARDFGRAFQTVDDYLDSELASPQPALQQIEIARLSLRPLQPAARELEELVEYLHARCHGKS